MPAKICDTWSRSWTAHVASSSRSVTSPSDGMQAAPVEVLFTDQLGQAGQVLGAEAGEVLDEVVEGRIGVALGVGEPVEPIERNRRAVLEDAFAYVRPSRSARR